MPKYERQRAPLLGWVFLLVLAAGFLYLLWSHPVATSLIFSLFALLALVEAPRTRRKLVKLSTARRGESICQFARHFDRRSVDTWIVRAVYEQLREEMATKYDIPIRPLDTFADLFIDNDDIDLSAAPEIAQRTGRSLEHSDRNPYFGKVKTAADLVHFFNAQPKVA